MKEKRLLEALSEVSDIFVEELDIVSDEQKNTVASKRYSKKQWFRWIATAVVLVLVFAIGGQYLLQGEINENQFSASIRNGAATLEEGEVLFTKNPWMQGTSKTKYPVYRNLSYVEGAGGAPHYFTQEELLVMAEDVAEKLDTEIIGYECAQHSYNGVETRSDVYQITAQTEVAEIRLYGNGKISIFFHEEVALSKQYKFSDDNTYSEAAQLIRYLTEKYKALLGFEHAEDECSISYDLTGQRNIFYSAYNVKSDNSDVLTEYCFQNVIFYGNENGLSMMHYGDVRVAAEYLGDYAIISEEEARTRLEAGQYFSIYSELDTIGGGFSDENIRLVELTYLTGSNCQYYQPYYCFYVESESYVEGISNYSLFFVPALTDEDFEQFPEIYPLGN